MKEEIFMQPPLYFAEQNMHIWCAQFHPNQNCIATALINGNIQILKYDEDSVDSIVKITDLHKSSARFCHFNSLGTLLATCGEDKRLGFIDQSGKIAHKIKKAHESPINRVKFLTEDIVASGDDQGAIKVWDLRQAESIFEAHEQSEAITGLIYDDNYSNLITSSLDGTVAIYDLKQGKQSERKLYSISDSADEELHNVISMKNGKFLACPSSENSVLVYKRQNIQTFVDRISGQPGSVEAILKIDENTFISGCQDGYVRGVSMKPNKILQILGQHEQNEHFPIQSLSISHCRNFLASTSHDNSIKFYDISNFIKSRAGVKLQEEDNTDIMEQNDVSNHNKEEDFQDMSDSDEEDSSQSEQQVQTKKKKKNKINMKMRNFQIKKATQKRFFQGL